MTTGIAACSSLQKKKYFIGFDPYPYIYIQEHDGYTLDIIYMFLQ